MKIHIPEQEGMHYGALRNVKVLDNGYIRLKVSAWKLSTNDNFYIDIAPIELDQIIVVSKQSEVKK